MPVTSYVHFVAITCCFRSMSLTLERTVHEPELACAGEGGHAV